MSEAARSDGGAVDGSGACWTSRSETVKCRVEADDKTGELRNRCERVKQTVRHCTGQPDQVVESYREETDTPVGATARGGAADAPASALLRPFLGDAGVDRLFGGVEAVSDSFQRLDKALRDAFPELHTPHGSEKREAPGDAGKSGTVAGPSATSTLHSGIPRRGGMDV